MEYTISLLMQGVYSKMMVLSDEGIGKCFEA